MGESKKNALRVNFDNKLKLEFHGVKVTSDAGLLAYREIDDAFGLTEMTANELTDNRIGKNTQHSLTALLRQSAYSRLAGYEDTNDAERLSVDPAMRHVVGERAKDKTAASVSQMGRFETEILTQPKNLETLINQPGQWVDDVHQHKSIKEIILDMDSSDSPTFGKQEGSAYNGHFGYTCYHPLFVFNQFKEGKYALKWTRLSCHDFDDNQVRLQLFCMAYNIGNFLRRLALPNQIKDWSLRTMREKLVKIGAKVVSHARYVTFQMAEVLVSRSLFYEILERIKRLKPVPNGYD